MQNMAGMKPPVMQHTIHFKNIPVIIFQQCSGGMSGQQITFRPNAVIFDCGQAEIIIR
jgi:hypothetical protein